MAMTRLGDQQLADVRPVGAARVHQLNTGFDSAEQLQVSATSRTARILFSMELAYLILRQSGMP